MTTKTINGLSLQEAIAENYKRRITGNRKRTQWDIKSYSHYITLRFPEITVPANQEWLSVNHKLAHVCDEHGKYDVAPKDMTRRQPGNGCRNCQSDKNKNNRRTFSYASVETKAKAAEMHAKGMTYKDIGSELNIAASTVCRWLDKEVRGRSHKRNNIWKKENYELNLAGQKAHRARPKRIADNAEARHKRRAVEYHCLGNAYIPDHPDANAEGWVEFDLSDLITTKTDKEEMSFVGADEAVKQRAIQQQKLERISGEKYSLEHLIPLSRGGTHQPENFANRALKLNLEKNNKRLISDDELFAKRVFGLI